MAVINPDEISSILKENIRNYDAKAEVSNIGSVLEVGDGIARIYGLRNIGAIACGYLADIVILDDLKTMKIHDVYKSGIRISELPEPPKAIYNDILIDDVYSVPLPENAFVLPEKEKRSVIGIIDGQIVTKKQTMTHQQIIDGLADGTVRKIAVVERHHNTGSFAAAYITGYGLRHGAVASTVAHDSHNIVIIGDNDEDMLFAVEELKRIGGGYVIVENRQTVGTLPLRLGGLMSLKSADKFIPELDNVIRKAYEMGVNPNIDPFTTLSFMALPVIPELRITDCGLFDVNLFNFTE